MSTKEFRIVKCDQAGCANALKVEEPFEHLYICPVCKEGDHGYSLGNPHAPEIRTIWCPTCKTHRDYAKQEFKWKFDGAFAYCPDHAKSGPVAHTNDIKRRRILTLHNQASQLEKELGEPAVFDASKDVLYGENLVLAKS